MHALFAKKASHLKYESKHTERLGFLKKKKKKNCSD